MKQPRDNSVESKAHVDKAFKVESRSEEVVPIEFNQYELAVISNKADPIKSSLTLAQDENAIVTPVLPPVISSQHERHNKAVNPINHWKMALMIIGISAVHIVGFWLLMQVADKTVDAFVEVVESQENVAETPSKKEINAYFMTAEQLAAIQASLQQEDETPKQNTQDVATELPAIDEASDKQREHKAEEASIKENDLQKSAPELDENAATASQERTMAPEPEKAPVVEVTMQQIQSQQDSELKAVVKLSDTVKAKPSLLQQFESEQAFNWNNVESMYLQDIEQVNSDNHLFDSDLFSSESGAIGIGSNDKLAIINQASHDMLKNLNQQSLDLLIGNQARNATSKSGASVSEMTPEMEDIELIIIEDTRQATTFDHRLDPNRIMRQGDTCYRVVKLPTQINPHAEGLGYAEPCDSAKMKKAISKSIEKRLAKIRLP
ncbi:hypothetical protein [Shewanella sp. 10N.286.52.A9]|uniref:hypothetical protein n=1 Tax=Shewanella sp. 10N.286.52.A9 TaxID=3229711 RepID=UPI00354FCD52